MLTASNCRRRGCRCFSPLSDSDHGLEGFTLWAYWCRQPIHSMWAAQLICLYWADNAACRCCTSHLKKKTSQKKPKKKKNIGRPRLRWKRNERALSNQNLDDAKKEEEEGANRTVRTMHRTAERAYVIDLEKHGPNRASLAEKQCHNPKSLC
jgi:hypothetical protein